MDNTFALSLVLALTLPGAPVAEDKPCRTCDSVRFLVLADWGGSNKLPYTTPVQHDVAEQMAITSERENASFILSLGDNFYSRGVTVVNDDRFQTTFENVYYQDSLHIPWYLIAGNHDHYGNVQVQINYSRFSHRWNFPDFYYKETKILPSGKVLDIVLLDTLILCGQSHPTRKGEQRVFRPKNIKAANSQWKWIEQTLEASSADYLLVGGHYPVYSVGRHGPTDCLYSKLEPLLYQHQVTAYLSGHDHSLQHIQTQRDEFFMDYFVIGGGSRSEKRRINLEAVPKKSQKFLMSKGQDGGFALFDASDNRLKIKFIDSKGSVRYEYCIKPRDKTKKITDDVA